MGDFNPRPHAGATTKRKKLAAVVLISTSAPLRWRPFYQESLRYFRRFQSTPPGKADRIDPVDAILDA